MTFTRIAALPLLACLMAGCVQQPKDEPIRVIRSDANRVILRGPVDATRTEPPARFDALAAHECGRSGKIAELDAMQQRQTFAFDISYRCVTAG